MAARILIVLLIVASAGLYARALGSHRAAPAAMPELALLPAAVDGWESRTLSMSDRVAEILAADVTLERVYRNPAGKEVHVFVAYFAEQAVNSQIHSPRQCVPGSGWNIVSTGSAALALPGGPQPATRLLIRRQGQAHEMLYWFRTRSGTVTGEYRLKWDLVKSSLARRPTDAVFIRYTAPVESQDALRSLAASLDAPLHSLLREAGLP